MLWLPSHTPCQPLQQLKVCDFGMTLTDDPRANMTQAVGTLRWMAPEVTHRFRQDSYYCSFTAEACTVSPSAQTNNRQILKIGLFVLALLFIISQVMLGSAYSFPCDVYSMGIIFWELLTKVRHPLFRNPCLHGHSAGTPHL